MYILTYRCNDNYTNTNNNNNNNLEATIFILCQICQENSIICRS